MPTPIDSLLFVHGALEAELRALAAAAKTCTDRASIGALSEGLASFVELMHLHHQGEEAGLFPAVERKDPGRGADYLSDHAAEGAAMDALASSARSAADGGDVEEASFATDLDALVQSGLTHIAKENDELLPWVRENFSAPEQGEIVGTIIAAIPKEKMSWIIPWIVARLDVERAAGYVGALSAAMPPPAFQAAREWIRNGIPASHWQALHERVPALSA